MSGQAIVNAPVPASGTGRLLTIDQSSQTAILDWKSFNIGNGSEVRFNQPGVTASTLNRIYGLDPSIIQGKLTANGQLFLINQNGILFDRGAQVNVHSLVASTLNISNDRFSSGALAGGGLTTPLAQGGYDDAGQTLPTRPNGTPPGTISIGVNAAAGAGAASITASQGGSILLFAPRIDNAGGVIASPDGQVILAAGSTAYLALPSDGSSTLRGFQVEVTAGPDAPLDLSSMIRNLGSISADRGNVTLAALAINQSGRVSATTAIQSSGSVYLQARTKGTAQAGSVVLGAGSTTEVLPDTTDAATLPEGQSFLDRRGQIQVSGRTIESHGTLQAPGGLINITASDPTNPTAARAYFDQGSVTSVAGDWVDVPYADNLLTFKVTSNELKDAPDQKNGLLKGATVTVDLRTGSPLLDLSGYAAAQGRSVGQKAATGGDLLITSSGSIIQRPGATLDASGGGYVYGGGTDATTQLLGDDGRIYGIGSAPEARSYRTILDSFTRTFPRWGVGVSQTFGGLLYGVGKQEAGYAEGKPGGTISLQSASGLILDGILKGGSTVGPNQLAGAPRGATLTIGAFDATANDFAAAQRIGNVTVAQSATDTLGPTFGVDSTLSEAQIDSVRLGADQLFSTGTSPLRGAFEQSSFDTVAINTNGRFTVPGGVTISAAPGSTLAVRSPRIEVGGTIDMPAGQIALLPQPTVAPLSPDLDVNVNPVSVAVRSGGSLSTTGVWINNASADGSFVGTPQPSARVTVAIDGTSSTASMLNGGTITIGATSDSSTVLERGAALDVGGGAALSAGRKLTAGSGGILTIGNGLSRALSSDWLQADLSGFAIGAGGKLSISTPRVVVDADITNGTLPSNTTRLTPELFAEHGFSSIKVTSVEGLAISDGTTIVASQKNLVVDPLVATALATGGDLRSIASVERLSDDVRQPTSIAFAATTSPFAPGQATLSMAPTAQIITDPKGIVSLSAVDQLRVDGRIVAPGGSISIALNAAPVNTLPPGNTTAPDLIIGSTADLSVAATFVRTPRNDPLVQGTMVDAGTISIGATGAGVQMQRGSRVDLGGLVQTVQTIAPDGSGQILQQSIDGNAGTLIVRTQGRTDLLSTIDAAAGSDHGAGGAFALELNAGFGNTGQADGSRVVVTQGPQAAPPSDAAVSIDALQSAGFDKVRLLSDNAIEMRGDIGATFRRGIRLDAPLIDITQDGRVSLTATQVALGQSLSPPFQDRGTSPVLPTRSGAGVLSAYADTIDLFGSLTINGAAETLLASNGDVRMTGRNVLLPAEVGVTAKGAQVGSLTTTGDVSVLAAQVYPSSRTDFTVSVVDQPGTVRPGGKIEITSNGKSKADVYSAGGKVTLNADLIAQGGTLEAPLGELVLNAGSSLGLTAGSVTSVSANGLTIPYGSTQAGLSWTYQDGPGSLNVLHSPSANGKRLSLNGSRIVVSPGATVDLSGGGDVQAIEFVPGSGGSSNVLLANNNYAIIPRSQLGSMPVDADTAAQKDLGFGFQTASVDTGVYDSLMIGKGTIVPAGEYVLLPGRYALLPGAYLVQLQMGSAYANMQAGQTTTLANGQTVVPGHFAASGTDVVRSTTVGVVVQPGSAALQSSDFALTGSQYFADQAALARTVAPRLPIDAGTLTIANVSSLALGGRVIATPGSVTTATGTTTGRGAQVDISATRIAVVDHVGDPAIDVGVLQLEGAALSGLGSSILLGGTRSDTATGIRLTTAASDVVIANSSAGALQAPEVLLAATGSIDVRAGSVITGTGAASPGSGSVIKAEAGGALIRLSNSAQASVDRGMATDASTGTIAIAAGAKLSADKALLLDATQSTRSLGTLEAGGASGAGGSLSLASSQVSLGQTTGVAGIEAGLVLSNADLGRLAALDDLVIKGYLGIDLYGAAQVGATILGSLTLDAPALRGQALSGSPAPAVTLAARRVVLVNSGASSAPDTAPSSATLAIAADRIEMGTGDKRLSGFAAVAMTAASEISTTGTGRTQVAADWTVSAPQVNAGSGSNQGWSASSGTGTDAATFRLVLANPSGAAASMTTTEAGGILALDGRSVDLSTAVRARSGAIAITARGNDDADGVRLSSGAVLDTSGAAKNYNGRIVTADGGRVSLSTALGTVDVAAGAAVVVAANAAGGNAGELEVQAARFALTGTVDGRAAQKGGGGQVTIDVNALPDFSDFNRRLNAGGFDASRDLRVRTGDLQVAATDTLTARRVQLTADAGRIDIDGTIDASSVQGKGSVKVWAATGLSLGAGSRVDASGTSTASDTAATLSDGGSVHLATEGGTLTFDRSANVDVRPGAKGATGSVVFGVTRDASNTMGASVLEGTILGARGDHGGPASVALEATRVYTSTGALRASDIQGYAADHLAFLAAADSATALGALKGDGGFPLSASLQGATEVRSGGNLSVSSPWDLTTSDWLTGGLPGTLTLRAGGNLTITSAVGLPNDNLPSGRTWNMRFVGGADLTGANPMSIQSGAATADGGSVLLSGNAAKLRTGTGAIDIAAAGDFTMTGVQSVVYTSGQIGAPDTVANAGDRWSQNGGAISISAGRNASGASNEWVTEWLRRPRTAPSVPASADWWVYRPNFQQGIGTLGGGDIAIRAGGDITGLSAMAPTTGRTVIASDGTKSIDVQGGGDLTVQANGSVQGGSYLVGRGEASLEARLDIGSTTPVQLYLMGASSGATPQQASATLGAGGAVRLQNVDNPTTLLMNASTGLGPSFGAGGTQVSTFFTYATNSTLNVTALSGDAFLGSTMALARTLVAAQAPTAATVAVTPAYPASLNVSAWNGDIAGDPTYPLITYPSPLSSTALLAQGSVRDLNLAPSDLLPGLVVNIAQPARPQSRQLTGDDLVPKPGQARIVSRDSGTEYVYDIQALDGSVLGTGANAITFNLPAVSRIRAGTDIKNISLALQNLSDSDVSVVRTDTGDVLPAGIEIRGPGRLVLQAGRNIDLGAASIVSGGNDLGGLIATGNNSNPSLTNPKSARLTLLAGIKGDVDLAKLDASYATIIGLNSNVDNALAFYRALNGDPDSTAVLAATSVADLAARDSAYAPYVALGTQYPAILSAYQNALRTHSLPLGTSTDASQAAQLYALLNKETNVAAITSARSLADLQTGTAGGAAYVAFAALDAAYPRVFADYRQRRGQGALPEGLTPIVFSDVLAGTVAAVVGPSAISGGNINSYLTSIQSYGGSDVDLWAPQGNVVVGLTTPSAARTIGVVTNAGGAIRSVLSGDFNINQGKVLTAQGGDIILYTAQGSIDAGRGAKTSISTPPPIRTPIFQLDSNGLPVQINGESVVIGYAYTIPASASGSGIQTLTSDPDGLGPRVAPAAGSIFLFAPGGTIDAGEAGIRSGGNLVLNAQTVLNATNISFGGSGAGVPVVATGSVASSVASSGGTSQAATSAAQDAGKAAAAAANSAAATAALQKPAILTVEVLGFGEKNCKETDKDCFAK